MWAPVLRQVQDERAEVGLVDLAGPVTRYHRQRRSSASSERLDSSGKEGGTAGSISRPFGDGFFVVVAEEKLWFCIFAYGSNMDWKRMKERCPTAKFVATASLQKHRLAFTKKATSGKFEGHGVADVVKSPKNTVWGVVFQIDEIDLGKLDKAEGYNPSNPNTEGYKREDRWVLEDGEEDRPLTVLTYVVQKKAGERDSASGRVSTAYFRRCWVLAFTGAIYSRT